MAAAHDYFVASADELAGLDFTRSPVGQLPDERTAELPDVDPTVALLSLVELLTTVDFDTLLAQATDEVVYDGGDDGPWVVAVEPAAVTAIQGADGDPEMEWEDAVMRWTKTDEFGEDVDEEALLEVTDELRRLCGQTGPGRRLYCWISR
jgi:hypothetical protein